MDVDVGHVHVAAVVQDADRGVVAGRCAHAIIQVADDGHELGRHALDVVGGPGLERLGQDGVVGVSAHVAHDTDRLVLPDAALDEQADQLGNDHRWVRVVDLHLRVVRQVVQVAPPRDRLVQQQLGSVGNHEVLLVDAQQATCVVGVVGVEEEREVLCDRVLVEADAAVQHALVHAVHVEETQAAAARTVSRDVEIVHGRGQVEAAEMHGVVAAGRLEEALAAPGEPEVGHLCLLTPLEDLTEEAAVVRKAHAVRRQAQRREAVEEAGGQTAETAVAEGGLVLVFLQLGQALARRGEFVAHGVVQAQVDEVVGEELALQELGGDVVELLFALVVAAALGRRRGVAHEGVEELEIGARVERFVREVLKSHWKRPFR